MAETGMLASDLLESFYEGEPQLGSDGKLHPINAVTKISRKQGILLYDLWKQIRPEDSLEIGLAYGYSTACILSARHEIGKGHHTALDPFQTSAWSGIGAMVAQRLGIAEHFSFLEEYSEIAIPEMIRSGREFQYIYIDGKHTFDATVVDFTLSARVLSKGGLIILDDMWLPSIRSVVSFVEANRVDFERVESPVRKVAIFRKIEHPDLRKWDHFEPFRVHSRQLRGRMRRKLRLPFPFRKSRKSRQIVRPWCTPS
jgi:predicted O-methyltransferase YrrM